MTTNLSRRTAMASSLAALSLLPGAAQAAVTPTDDREEWLALYHAFCRAERAFRVIQEDLDLDVLWETPEAHIYLAAEQAISDKPANTFTGIAVKLALWVHQDGEPPDLNPKMDDAEFPMAVSAWRDAIRLAGLPEGLGTTPYREKLLGLGGDND